LLPAADNLEAARTNPTSRILIALGLLVLSAGLSSIRWPFQAYEPEPTKSGNPVVATVGTSSITLREVEQAAALPLYQADQQRSQLLHQTLQRKIEETLMAAEASRKGVSVSQLLAEASQSESVARIANLPAPVKRLSPGTTQDSPSHGASHDPQEQARIRQSLLVSLRSKTDIRIALPPPEPLLLTVSVDDDPLIGPVDAPVTIVEFSDFQCPYCQKSVGVLKELRRLYGEKIRMVNRDYPGPNYPHAPQAAEAAQCAGEQSRFWEYHDILFDRQIPGKGWGFACFGEGTRTSAGQLCDLFKYRTLSRRSGQRPSRWFHARDYQHADIFHQRPPFSEGSTLCRVSSCD